MCGSPSRHRISEVAGGADTESIETPAFPWSPAAAAEKAVVVDDADVAAIVTLVAAEGTDGRWAFCASAFHTLHLAGAEEIVAVAFGGLVAFVTAALDSIAGGGIGPRAGVAGDTAAAVGVAHRVAVAEGWLRAVARSKAGDAVVEGFTADGWFGAG